MLETYERVRRSRFNAVINRMQLIPADIIYNTREGLNWKWEEKKRTTFIFFLSLLFLLSLVFDATSNDERVSSSFSWYQGHRSVCSTR